MRKKVLTLLIAILSLFTFISCTTNNVENSIINNENISNNKNTNENKDATNNNTNSESDKTTLPENDAKELLLTSISTAAKDGKVIECDFKAKYNIIDDVINSWGKESESNFIENTYLDHYNILYPKGTNNLMADDPGKEW